MAALTHDNKHNMYDNDSPRGVSADDAEKHAVHGDGTHTHDADFLKHTDSNEESRDPRITQFTHAQQRKIVHRIDRRLTVTLGIMYCISLMDRTNLSAANIAGFVCPWRFMESIG